MKIVALGHVDLVHEQAIWPQRHAHAIVAAIVAKRERQIGQDAKDLSAVLLPFGGDGPNAALWWDLHQLKSVVGLIEVAGAIILGREPRLEVGEHKRRGAKDGVIAGALLPKLRALGVVFQLPTGKVNDAVVAQIVLRAPLLAEQALVAQQLAQIPALGLAQPRQLALALIEPTQQKPGVFSQWRELEDQVGEVDRRVVGPRLLTRTQIEVTSRELLKPGNEIDWELAGFLLGREWKCPIRIEVLTAELGPADFPVRGKLSRIAFGRALSHEQEQQGGQHHLLFGRNQAISKAWLGWGMRAWASGLLILASFCWNGPDAIASADAFWAQEPTEVEEVEQAVRTLKARKLSWDDKAEAMDTLLAAGPEGCAELASHLAKACLSLDTSFHKEWERLERDFAKQASKLAESRLNKSTLKRVDELRKTWLKASRSDSLSKSQVKEVCDTAHEELQTLLDVSVVQVWDAAPKLEARWTELIQRLDDQVFLHDYWAAARKELLAAGGSWPRKSFVKQELPDPLLYEEQILKKLERAARLATVMPEKDRKTILANEPDLAQLESEEAAGIVQLNRIRVRAGLNTLRVDLKLCDAGRGHSKDMVEHKFFAHESPLPGKKSPSNRAALAGTSGGAENIAAGQNSGHGAIRAWWYSPGHHRNMMGGHSRIGLGRHENHWTQMFG